MNTLSMSKNYSGSMKPISEQKPAVPKEQLQGKKLTLVSIRTGVKTKNGEQEIYTVKVEGQSENVDFFGGKGLRTQELSVGDVFVLDQMDTGKANPMWYARSPSDKPQKARK